MTLETTTNKTIFLGNNATTTFTYSFIIPTAASARVIYTDADGVELEVAPAAYTITGINDPDGGTVEYPLSGSPIATGTTLTVERIVPLEQTTDLVNQGGYYPSVVEDALDYQMMAIQQIQEVQERTLRGNVTDPASVTYELPTVAQRAGGVLAFDDDGNPVVWDGTLDPLTVSGPMTPVVQASTTAAALVALGAFPSSGGTITGSTVIQGDLDVTGAITANGNDLVTDFPFTITRQWGAIANGTYVLGVAPYAFSVSGVKYNVGSGGGSFTMAVQIGGASITGVSAVTVSSATTATATATGANTGATGALITAVISGTTGSPVNAWISVIGTRTL
jgi:hypothetical protein